MRVSILRAILLIIAVPDLVLQMQIKLHLTDSSGTDGTHRTTLPHGCLSAAAWPVGDTPDP